MADEFDKKAAQYRKEAQHQRATSEPVRLSPQERQGLQDAKTRDLEDRARTTKTEMGKTFKKGGVARGGGAATRGTKFVGVR